MFWRDISLGTSFLSVDSHLLDNGPGGSCRGGGEGREMGVVGDSIRCDDLDPGVSRHCGNLARSDIRINLMTKPAWG